MMINSLEKKLRDGAFVLIALVAGFFVVAIILTVFPIERITYPKATNDLSVIKTWSEKEVYSFLDDLGCFDIPYGEEFESKFPEEVGFCRKVRNIWTEKYDKNKESNVNWELYHSLDKGGE